MQPLTVLEDLYVFSDREPSPGSGAESLAVIHLILQCGEERFSGGVVPAGTRSTDAGQNAIIDAESVKLGRGVLPGLNRSSQHLNQGRYGARARLGRGNDGPAADVVARSSTGRPQGTSEIVLDDGLAGSDKYRRRARGRRVGGRRRPVVPRTWRGETSIGFPCGLGPVSVVCRA